MEPLSLARSLTALSKPFGIRSALGLVLLGTGLLPAVLVPLPSVALTPLALTPLEKTPAVLRSGVEPIAIEDPSPQELQLERDIPLEGATPAGVTPETKLPEAKPPEAKPPEMKPEANSEKKPERNSRKKPARNSENKPKTKPETKPENNSEKKPDSDQKSEDRIYLADRQVSFVPPAGFTVMTNEEINLKFPGTMPPQYAYGNDRRNVSIGISLSDIDLAPEQLAEVRQFLETYLADAVPGFEWVARDYETISGNRWIKLEFISQALDTKVHNDLYITSFKGKLLGFNFNSVVALEKKLRAELDASRASILLDALATAQEGDALELSKANRF